MADLFFLQEDYEALQAYVAAAEARQREAMASIGEVIEHTSGTWHDNPAFDYAQEQSRMWTMEVQKRTAILTQAKIVQPTQQSDTVEIGSRVSYRNETRGFVDEITVGSYMNIGPRKDDEDVISYAAPLGQALMGHRVGDTVTVALESRKFSVTVLRISSS